MQSSRRGTDRTYTRMFSRSSRPTPRTKHRRFLRVEPLEQRLVMSTYWVSPSGNDSNPGTQAQPWQTLQVPCRLACAGDTMNVEAGTYTGFIVGWDNTGRRYGTIAGTAGHPITIQADPSAAPGSVIIGSRDNKTPCGIDLEPGCSYITLKGFTITNSDRSISSYGIKVAQSDGVNILNLYNVWYGKDRHLHVFQFGIASFRNNLSYNNGEHGIYASNSPQNVQILTTSPMTTTSGGIQVNAYASQGGPGTVAKRPPSPTISSTTMAPVAVMPSILMACKTRQSRTT